MTKIHFADVPNKKAETGTSACKSFQVRLNSIDYKIKRCWCNNGQGEYGNETFRNVLAARGNTYEPCPLYAHHMNGVAENKICTITE